MNQMRNFWKKNWGEICVWGAIVSIFGAGLLFYDREVKKNTNLMGGVSKKWEGVEGAEKLGRILYPAEANCVKLTPNLYGVRVEISTGEERGFVKSYFIPRKKLEELAK